MARSPILLALGASLRQRRLLGKRARRPVVRQFEIGLAKQFAAAALCYSIRNRNAASPPAVVILEAILERL